MRKWSWLVWVCIGLGIVTIAMISLYFWSTWSPSLSSDSGIWANWGAFLSPIVSLITMIILIMTIQSQEKQEERNLIVSKKEQLGICLLEYYRIIPIFLNEYEAIVEINIKMQKKITRMSNLRSLIRELEDDMDRGLDDENIKNQEKIKKLKIKLKSMKKLFRLDQSSYKKLIEKIDNHSNKLTQLHSEIDLLVIMFFNNNLGAKILAMAYYSMYIFLDPKYYYKKIQTFRKEIFLAFKIDSVNHIKEHKNLLSNETISFVHVMKDIMIELDAKYNLSVSDEFNVSEN